jgi:hypothetical protein
VGQILRLYQPLQIAGAFYPKGDVKLGKGEGETNPVILKHWLVKERIKDGKAVVIEKSVPKNPKVPETPKVPDIPANADKLTKKKA